jgi:G3E family GTPase
LAARITRRLAAEGVSIPFNVLGGYLGAGKTTLVNHLLRHARGNRLALIINDFGAINIDAELISEQTDDQISLTNGCICCGMSAGFDEAIESLLKRDPLPDRIIVEASGVADVTALAQYGHHPGLRLDSIIVLADAETVRAKARDKYVDKTVLRQLRGADLIVLNKTDLVTAEAVDDLRRWLEQISPGVPVVSSRYGQIPIGAFFGAGHINTAENEAAHQPGDHQAGDHEHYITWHFEREAPLTRAQVETFIAALPATVLRGKGFFSVGSEAGGRCLLYQQVGRRWTLTPHPEGDTTRFVLIGLAAELDLETLDTAAACHLG